MHNHAHFWFTRPFFYEQDVRLVVSATISLFIRYNPTQSFRSQYLRGIATSPVTLRHFINSGNNYLNKKIWIFYSPANPAHPQGWWPRSRRRARLRFWCAIGFPSSKAKFNALVLIVQDFFSLKPVAPAWPGATCLCHISPVAPCHARNASGIWCGCLALSCIIIMYLDFLDFFLSLITYSFIFNNKAIVAKYAVM